MSASTYNLLDEPTFPVRWRPGAPGPLPERVGFEELLLRSHDILGLAIAEPPAHSALLRILYALTARVTKLDAASPDEWDERRYQVLDAGQLPREGVQEYVDQYRKRFFVFDPEGGRPWMQDPRLADQCDASKTAGVNKLIVTRASGNNHAWFRHGSDAQPDLPSVPDAVLHLLTWHYYGPSGRCSAREVGGFKTASATAGPLRTALSYHPEGDTLFETLLAGLVPPPFAMGSEEDRCPWEWDTLPDPDAAPPVPAGPYGRMTACSQHALLLVPDETRPGLVRDAYITWAYREGRIPRDDAFVVWQVSKQGNRYPRHASSQRSLWRDLDALLLKEPVGSTQARRPAIFDYAPEVSDRLRVRALGFEQEGQAKDTQFVDASTPPILDCVDDGVRPTAFAVAKLRQFGEMYGFRLDRAVKRAWGAYLDDSKESGKAWSDEAAARYWPQAEALFWTQFNHLDRSGTAHESGLDPAVVRKEVVTLALRVYSEVTKGATRTARGAKAVTEARVEIFGGRRGKRA